MCKVQMFFTKPEVKWEKLNVKVLTGQWNWVQNPETGRRGLFVVEFTPDVDVWPGEVGHESLHVASSVRVKAFSCAGCVSKLNLSTVALEGCEEMVVPSGFVETWSELFPSSEEMGAEPCLPVGRGRVYNVGSISSDSFDGQWISENRAQVRIRPPSLARKYRWMAIIGCEWGAESADLRVTASLSCMPL